jgi:catechol-2,3-dioxygenase
MHHIAFEYDSFEELNSTFLRLRDAGIEPVFCLDHGMTFSYYYSDPDGNYVELQVDNFGDWAESSEWMRSSPAFKDDPLGKFVEPGRVAEAFAHGLTFEQIHARAMLGELAPDAPPLELPVD